MSQRGAAPDGDALGLARKDAAPAETIERVHALLDGLGFPRARARVTRWTAGIECHSCHLRFENYPLIFANGKGVTPELAYAGALAEFVERLQCRTDAVFTDAGNIHQLAPFDPPAMTPVSELASAHPRLFAAELASLAQPSDRELPCLPFADVLGRRVVQLPFEVLCLITGSSGMCAGNTAEEALAHGICEVFERHVIHELECGRVAGLPSLPLEGLPIRTAVLRRQIDALASSGVELLVKDATLGGAFPVLAAVLTDLAAGTSHVAFGSDPDFDAALSRCLTEAFQGTDRLFRRLSRSGAAAPLDTYNNLEVLRDRLMADAGPSCADGAFGSVSGNTQAVRFAVERVRRSGRALYVRDCSYFGFPAYYVYVEGLSALRDVRSGELPQIGIRAAEVRAVLYRLRHASRSEVAGCAAVLFHELSRNDPIPDGLFVRELLRAPVASCVGLRPLLTLMLVEAGAVGEAREVQAWPPVASEDLVERPTPTSAARWFQPYADTRRQVVSAGELAARFETAFGATPGDLAGNDARTGDLLLPRCQSVYSCPSCPCRPLCRIEEWYRLARRLRSRAVPVQQERLLERLES